MTTRVTLGKMQNPIRGFLHGGAAAASVMGLVLMVIRASPDAKALASSMVFGVSLIVMYTVSSLYHSIPWGEVSKTRMRKADHSMIYLVVAATFTPVASAALTGPTLILALAMMWAIASTGIILKLWASDVKTSLSVTLQLVMGWSALIWTPAIYSQLGLVPVVLILAGGLSYTVGAVIFATQRPRLFPRTFSYHEMFHVLVVTGSFIHFLVVYAYAIPEMTG